MRTFQGSPVRRYVDPRTSRSVPNRGPWLINDRPVGVAAYIVAWRRAFGEPPVCRPIAIAPGPRGRKRALDRRRPRRGCEHEFEYREDWEGDAGVINGTHTLRWFECPDCGATRPASWEDAPSFDDDC